MKNRLILLILSIIPLLSGCAFFNTLWNGWQAFDAGTKKESALYREKKDSAQVREAVKKDFERAVQKAEKTVSYYPKQHRNHDDAFYLKGRALYQLGGYSEASLAFKSLQKFYPESRRVPESWLWLAKSFAASGNYEAADEAYQFCIDQYPELNKHQEVTVLRAELAVFMKGKSQAIPFLEAALLEVTDPGRRISIINKLAGLYIDFEQYENALKHISTAPSFDKSYRDLYYDVRYKELICRRELGEYDKAEIILESLIKNRHFTDRQSDLRYELAVLFLYQNRADEARKILLDLTAAEKPTETTAKAWFELAEIYLDRDGKLTEGAEALRKTVSITTNGKLRAEASQRLAGLDAVKRITDSLAAGIPDSIDEWDLRFKLGERYWLNSKLPDSALVQYEKILADSTVKKPIYVKTLFSKAWILQEIKKDTAAGKIIFEKIISDYPSFAEAKESQKLLDLPVTILVRKDSAETMFLEAEKKRLASSGYSKDVYYSYLLTAVKYPDIKETAAKALYAAGWVVNARDEQTEKVDTAAAKIFGRLCRDYPESDQCRAVTKMLEQEQVKGYVETYTKFLEEKKKEPDAAEIEAEVLPESSKEATKNLPPVEIPDFTRWF